MPILPGFIQNAALLLVLGLLLDLRTRHASLNDARGSRWVFGLLLGAASVSTMLFPVRVEPGLVFDTRGLVLAICGVYFGLVPTAVAMALTATFRVLVIGGPATLAGLAFIAGAGASGLGLRAWHRRAHTEPSNIQFALLGLTVGTWQLLLAAPQLPPGDGALFRSLAVTLPSVSAVATS